MSIFKNLFKREKSEELKETKKETKEKKERKNKPEKELRKVEAKISKRKEKRKIHPRINEILLAPVITEKASRLTTENQYLFRVGRAANKTEIKKAVEQTFGVDVLKVRVLKVPSKRKRLGRRLEGRKRGYKKAIVKIKEGQAIEVLPR